MRFVVTELLENSVTATVRRHAAPPSRTRFDHFMVQPMPLTPLALTASHAPRHAAEGVRSGVSGRGAAHTKLASSHHSCTDAVDPLDPCGKSGGKWVDGQDGSVGKMADSTASGPLWQQRPYPAPGSVLRMKSGLKR